MKNRIKAYAEMVLIAAFVVFIDQFSKYLVRTRLALREVWVPFEALKNFFRIIHWKNTGVAFGLFQGSGWIFTIVGIGIVVLIVVFYNQVSDGPRYWRVALAMQLGGAVGNLIDRVNPKLGYVVDFLWFGNFPVFNLADAAIVIGAFLLIIFMWKEEKQNKETQAAAEDTGDSNE